MKTICPNCSCEIISDGCDCCENCQCQICDVNTSE